MAENHPDVWRLSSSVMTSHGSAVASDSVCMPKLEPLLGIMATTVNPVTAAVGPVVLPPRPHPTLPPAPSPDTPLPAVKEIIRHNGCMLFPQNPNLSPPSTRARPPGCKTVFVGGLPENTSEDIIREVFSPCGDIIALRKSKKNFCHVRFSEEFMVDKALYLSGYRLRIGSSMDKKDSAKIHVDFAQARDDLYEWECKQRLLERENRLQHQDQRDYHMHEEQAPPSLTPASLPPTPHPHFSEHEAAVLAEGLKDRKQFSWAASVLLLWLDGGEVNRSSANKMYALIESANVHATQLRRDATQQRRALRRAQDAFNSALTGILMQLDQISSVLVASGRQKSRDHFSKAQRKNIDMWTRQCQVHSDEVSGLRRQDDEDDQDEDEDEDDDDEGPCNKKMKMVKMKICGEEEGAPCPAAATLEHHFLRWQMDAYEKQAQLLAGKASGQDGDHHVLAVAGWQWPDASVQLLNQRVLQMQQQVLRLQDELSGKEGELQQAREDSHFLERELLSLQHKLVKNSVEGSVLELREKVNGFLSPSFVNRERRRSEGGGAGGGLVSEKEALLLGVMSAFLQVHPFGANLEYLGSYVQRLDSQVSSGQLERLMVRLPLMFRQELSGVGATLEKRWKFCGFESLQSA
ncbi:ecto-NOX disulfide-thiol exchanger 1-like isoform X2 [Phyllopteryx taeniolatus]|uniref:ecto-NOX disulfide-thiol exchanger 1-like isoform X2 n=1 Tax=Phyllopteryx taeniolatus TaxID=161469 RepID=UPI002AD462AE|nr:ecto-NOX disulfide-thiol exchanger 1-like isoform X2 [Phyllopteryx taeniolatus]